MHQITWGTIAVNTKIAKLIDHIFIALTVVGILTLSFPHYAAATTVQDYQPLSFEVSDLAAAQAPQIESVETETAVVLELAPDPRIEILRGYLLSKKSPAAGYAEDILKNDKYLLLVGISFAESNFCKKNIRPYNCWGIGGGYPEEYQSYPHAFERANLLLTRYAERGLTTPETIRNRWVGWENDDWIIAVNQAIREMQTLGL